MTEVSNHNNFSTADIEKYWQGQLAPGQMHALEKAALEDPFLADAMEGYRERSREKSRDIAELAERLRERVAEREVRVLPFGNWWKIAAAIIVLAGAVWTWQWMSTKNKPVELAAGNAKKQSPAPGTANVASDSMQAITPVVVAVDSGALAKHDADRQPVLANKTTVAPAYKRPPVYYNHDTQFAVAPPPAAAAAKASVDDQALQGKLAGAETRRLKKDTVDMLLRDVAVSPKPALSEDKEKVNREDILKKAPAQNNQAYLNTFIGQVVDNSNKPVPGASVTIPGTQNGVATDNKGYFSLKTPDTALKVSVASVGFAQRDAVLRNNVAGSGPYFNNQIVLQQNNAALNEVVVTGYGTQKRKDIGGNVSVTVLDAEPVTGWDKYSNYLDANKKIFDSSAAGHGFVVVSFWVTRDGKLRNIKIEKSLNKTLDAEAIRLIKNGPAWHVLKGKKSRASVMVKF